VKEDFLRLIPIDKKLDPAWVASLTARGEPETFTGEALERIGMPVGGMFCGTMYLGGDGRLWLWDIFNNYRLGIEPNGTTHLGQPMNAIWGSSYIAPLLARNYRLVEQGFALTVKTATGEVRRTLDAEKGSGFRDVSFTGEYPIGVVRYADPEVPVTVKLEAFSPFSPMEVKDSSLPATVFSFELTNTGKEAVEVSLEGVLENAVFHNHRFLGGNRRAAARDIAGATVVDLTATMDSDSSGKNPDVVLEDWAKPTFAEAGWTVEGDAFGNGPVPRASLPAYMGDVGGDTLNVANSHAGNQYTELAARENATGKLISKPFTIDRNFLCFWIGGGSDPSKLGLSLLIDGKIVHNATGVNANRMVVQSFDVSAHKGKEARLEIYDQKTAEWANIGVGKIWLSDNGLLTTEQLKRMPDVGSMALALLGSPAEVRGADQETKISGKLSGKLGRTLTLQPGKAEVVNFVIAWHFPHAKPMIPGHPAEYHDRHYKARFADAGAVCAYVAEHFSRLASQTRLWRDTWYDSSLPYWFLNRTFANTTTLATSTCYMLGDNRFYADEGVGCCAGTCIHVWHYAQAPGRLFPEIERNHREHVDFGLALTAEGVVKYRGEVGDWYAIDGQAGRILGVYREHLMSPDAAFLKRLWPATKKAIEKMIATDADGDGIVHGPLHNTLDADWNGIVPWLCGMYHAGLRAGEKMAEEVGDKAFAAKCRKILDVASKSLDKLCWNDGYGYYVHIGDPARATEVGAYEGCHIDQVLGQAWAWQVALGDVMPRGHVRRCLESLWKYNFTPDVGPFRKVKTAGRWYAMPGEGGLIMLSNPFAPDIQFTGPSAPTSMYFNECMSGFEHQVAAHMMWENMITESLAVTRAIHDRYSPRLRNPYNEIECSDHYGRAMASYGTFLAACGYEYDGPKKHLGFAPRLTPENFKTAFTSAEGWGSFSQKITGRTLEARVAVKYGKLSLKTFGLTLPASGPRGAKVTATLDGKPVPASISLTGNRATVALETTIIAGQTLVVTVS
jgi:uncharacterized protein (DUF608 family)